MRSAEGGGRRRGGEARFLRALDLGDAAVVHDELDDSEAKGLDLFADEALPVRFR